MSNNRMEETRNRDAATADAEISGMEDVLRDFRASVHAWSEAAYRQRSIAHRPVRMAFRRSLAWVLSLVGAVGIAGGGIYARHHQQGLARQAEQQAEHQRLVQQEHAREEDELLASIESDLSRAVPAAMEPLATIPRDAQGR